MYYNPSKSVYTIKSNTMKLANLAGLRFTRFTQVSFVQRNWPALQHFFRFDSDDSFLIPLLMNIFKLYINFWASTRWEIQVSRCLIAWALYTMHIIMQREWGDPKHLLQHISREVQFSNVVLCSKLTFNIQFKYNVNNISQKELRMLRQFKTSLSCAIVHIAYWTMDITFWWLLSVLEDWVTVPLPLDYVRLLTSVWMLSQFTKFINETVSIGTWVI